MSPSRIAISLAALVTFSLPLAALTVSSTSFVPYSQGNSPEGALALDASGNLYGTTTGGGAYGVGAAFKLAPNGSLTTLPWTRTNSMFFFRQLLPGNDGFAYGVSRGGTSGLGMIIRMSPDGTVTSLVNFTGTNGSDGRSLRLANDGNLYGLAIGSDTGRSIVFKLTPQGTLTTLASFNGVAAAFIQASDGNFYGVTQNGAPHGAPGSGSVFRLTLGGTFTTLAYFSGTNGGSPTGGLVQAKDGAIYGTTLYAGSGYEDGFGTVFRFTLAGKLTTVVKFNSTNGANPVGGLLQDSAGNLYGTTIHGGTANDGVVFKLTPGAAGYSLSTLANFTGTNGRSSYGDLVQDPHGNLYGTTIYGGTSDAGTVFKVTPTGVLTTLYSFTDQNQGANPEGELIQGHDGNFYGTTQVYGASNLGTIFQATPAGALTTLINFNGTNGSNPNAALIQDSLGNFYGTTAAGGACELGTIFKLAADGSLTTLANFNLTDNGGYPAGPLLQGKDGNFYGTTSGVNPFGTDFATNGNIFRLTPDGTLTTLINFDQTNGARPYSGVIEDAEGQLLGTTSLGGMAGYGTVFKVTRHATGPVLATLVNFAFNNGGYSHAGLIQDTHGAFYGTTTMGGQLGGGTVFKLTHTNAGEILTTLVDFNTTNGAQPYGKLTRAKDGNFYGTTYLGGASDDGTVFRLTPSGTLTTLLAFNSDNGANPHAGVIQASDGNFYGTTENGGTVGSGTFYRLSPANSDEVTFASAATIPFTASSYTIQGSALRLSLTYSPDPGSVLTVIRSTGDSPINGTYTNLPDGGSISAIYQGTTYTFSASYSGGTGHDLTLTLIRAVQPQTVTFAPIPNQVYGSAPLLLNATASSGQPITYTHTGPVSIAGNTATITGVGTIDIRATQAGSASYTSASFLRTFTVGAGSQVTTFPAIASATVGQTITLPATSTSALPITYSILPTSGYTGTATLSGSTLTFTHAGKIKLAADQPGDANYLPAEQVRENITIAAGP